MAATLQVFELIFDNKYNQDGYRLAGTFIEGAVVIVTTQSLHGRELFVELKGEVRNGWVNKVSDKIYDSVEICLNSRLSLLRPTDSLPPGRHDVPFRAQLPPSLPSSFEGEFGQIRYAARAALLSVESGDAAFSDRVFQIKDRVDLGTRPVTKHPVEVVDRTDFACCCIPLGAVCATITIPRNGFLPSESIAISAEIYNGSRKTIKDSHMSLIQYAEFSAMSRYESAEDHKEMTYTLAALDKGNIEPHRTLRMQSEIIHIPPIVIPTLTHRLLSVNYMLRFEARPGIEIEIPITIGSLNSAPYISQTAH